MQDNLYEEYKNNGYLISWSNNDNQIQRKLDIAELGLVGTEISEAMEEIRKHKTDREHLAEECADIIIRVMNFMSRKGLDLDITLWLKNNRNKQRGNLHGKAV